VLPAVDNDHWRLTYLNNINACIMFAPLVWWFEREALLEHFETLRSPAFIVNMLLAGVFGFSIGIVTVMQIKATRYTHCHCCRALLHALSTDTSLIIVAAVF
jgi:solute carrier family 35 (GDP-fucose transporter), member C1